MEEHVFDIRHREKVYKLYLPNCSNDHIQKYISEKAKPYEHGMLMDIEKRLFAGDTIIDIGANIGNHSVFFSSVIGAKVYAFEPNSKLVESIKASIKLNSLQEFITIYPFALSDHEGHGHFLREMPDNLGAQEVVAGDGDLPIKTLDSLEITDHVSAIKIDVEGMELSVLRGAVRTIKESRPLIYVEAQNRLRAQPIAEWMTVHNYCYWRAFNATPTLLFVPIEKLTLSMISEHLNNDIAMIISGQKEKIGQLKNTIESMS